MTISAHIRDRIPKSGPIERSELLMRAADEIDRLREALTNISQGDIGRPHRIEMCVHGAYGFDCCENCYMDYAAKVLEELK